MHIKPKKSLGQNFLFDKNIQRKIISALDLKPSDIILEIGAGRGELAALIAKEAAKVYALELDSSLCTILKENLKLHSNAEIINKDILKINLGRYFSHLKKKIKVFGNIPYYISSPIIECLLKARRKIEVIFLTVQKEFAQRAVAQPGSGDLGAFSCFVQYYADPKILFMIKKNSFYPAPKVDSCFLRISPKRKLLLKKEEEGVFFKVIRAAFNKRRKTLRNSLEGVVSPQKLTAFFNKHNIDPDIRPQDLALQDFINLIKVKKGF
jgi:16S rRNA (adenine1518-N6/adenine1519-N6)-dimethyltransferase